MKLSRVIKIVKLVNISFIVFALGLFAMAMFSFLSDAGFCMEEGVKSSALAAKDIGLACIGAGIAIGCSTLGAGIAVAVVGSAAVGAIAEKPELTTKSILYVGLAEGIGIYGLIVSIMILLKF